MKKSFRTLAYAAMMLLVLTVVTGCKEVMSSFDNPVSPYLEVSESVNVGVGKTAKIEVTTISSGKITFTPADESIATVDGNGVVTGVKAGETTVTVSVAKVMQNGSEIYAAASKKVKIIVGAGTGDVTEPLTFELPKGGTLVINNPLALEMKYSKNGGEKVSFDDTYKTIPANEGDKIAFFGNNVAYYDVTKGQGTKICISQESTGSNGYKGVMIYGNIMSLVSEDDFANCKELKADYAFANLFGWNNSDLNYNHYSKDLILPATKLTKYCYEYMFGGNSKMTRMPIIGATELAEGCFNGMFYGCSNLTEVKDFAITEVDKIPANSFNSMFSYCTSLATAPALPKAKILGDYCYHDMFSYCSKLTSAPEISADSIGQRACNYMFGSCTSLTSSPKLYVKKGENNCFNYMFAYCTSLTTASEISADSIGQSALYGMFNSCSSLTKSPKISIKEGAGNCFYEMFGNCTSLTSASEIIADSLGQFACNYMYYNTGLTTSPKISVKKIAPYCFYEMYPSCTSLTTASEITADIVYDYGLYYMFLNCTSLTTAPKISVKKGYYNCFRYMFPGCDALETGSEIVADSLGSAACSSMFSGKTNLKTAPKISVKIASSSCFNGMYQGCTSLTTAAEISADSIGSSACSYMFQNCTSLTEAPGLKIKKLASSSFRSMFQNCTSLTTAPALPATKLADRCYYQMFQNCTSLTTAPALPATELADRCYYRMFKGCTSLTTAPALPATKLAISCYYEMFQNCTALKSAKVKAGFSSSSCSGMFYGCSAEGAKLHTTEANKARWENYFGDGSNWTVVADY